MLSWAGYISWKLCARTRLVYFACSAANPLCTLIEEERPGKSEESNLVRGILRSVRSARLEGRASVNPSWGC